MDRAQKNMLYSLAFQQYMPAIRNRLSNLLFGGSDQIQDYSPEADLPAQGSIPVMDMRRAPQFPATTVIDDRRDATQRDIDSINLGNLKTSNLYLEDLTPEIRARVLKKVRDYMAATQQEQ